MLGVTTPVARDSRRDHALDSWLQNAPYSGLELIKYRGEKHPRSS